MNFGKRIIELPVSKLIQLRAKYPKCFKGSSRVKRKCNHCGAIQPICWSANWCASCTYPDTLFSVFAKIKKPEPKRY